MVYIDMGKSRVRQDHRIVWITNPLSGHSWPEHTLIDRWTVSGGYWPAASFNNEGRADREAAERNAHDAKFPYEPPRTQRELDYVVATAHLRNENGEF